MHWGSYAVGLVCSGVSPTRLLWLAAATLQKTSSFVVPLFHSLFGEARSFVVLYRPSRKDPTQRQPIQSPIRPDGSGRPARSTGAKGR